MFVALSCAIVSCPPFPFKDCVRRALGPSDTDNIHFLSVQFEETTSPLLSHVTVSVFPSGPVQVPLKPVGLKSATIDAVLSLLYVTDMQCLRLWACRQT